jgi:putative transposase
VYLRHPNGKKIWRAEMTAWLDYRSRYIAGVWITESESGFTTMHSLSHAIIKHNHIPAWIYIDNGSGYKASLMTDEATGFYGRMGISVTNALPGNSKGKGNIERFFRTYEEQMGKTLPGYCGTGMAAEVKSQWVRRANAGKEYVLTIDEWLMKFDEFLNHPTEGYHHSVHSATGKTPAEMWATLDRLPLVTENDPDAAEMALCWPRARVNVRNCMFVLHGRNYKNREALEAYNGQEMHAEYSVHDDSYVRVLDTAGRLVCLADLVQKTPLLPVSRMEEAKQKREAAQIKRLDNKIKEVEMRARDAIPYEQRNATVLDLYGNSKFEEEKKPELLEIEIEKCGEEQGQIEIDPFDTDY